MLILLRNAFCFITVTVFICLKILCPGIGEDSLLWCSKCSKGRNVEVEQDQDSNKVKFNTWKLSSANTIILSFMVNGLFF